MNEKEQVDVLSAEDEVQILNNINQYRTEIARLKEMKTNMEILKQQPNQATTEQGGKGQSQGKQYSLNSGHTTDHSSSFVSSDNGYINGGFVTNLLMSLLFGFACGAIATAIYIFTNLSKVTLSL